MVLFLSAEQMPAVVAALEPTYGPEAPAVAAYRVGWPDQQLIRGTLSEVARRMAEAGITRTALVMIGPMVDDSVPSESHLYNRGFSHLFRKAAEPPEPRGEGDEPQPRP
jgi:precorrin-4/cobalt-precorrin-4 C11-methyltransferase